MENRSNGIVSRQVLQQYIQKKKNPIAKSTRKHDLITNEGK